MPQRNFFIEFSAGSTEQELRQFLEHAGYKTITVRDTSQNNDGIIITETLLQGIWNHDTGYATCEDKCANHAKPRHVAYEALTEHQRNSFAEAVAAFMDRSRQQAFQPIQFLDPDDFEDIAISPS